MVKGMISLYFGFDTHMVLVKEIFTYCPAAEAQVYSNTVLHCPTLQTRSHMDRTHLAGLCRKF